MKGWRSGEREWSWVWSFPGASFVSNLQALVLGDCVFPVHTYAQVITLETQFGAWEIVIQRVSCVKPFWEGSKWCSCFGKYFQTMEVHLKSGSFIFLIPISTGRKCKLTKCGVGRRFAERRMVSWDWSPDGLGEFFAVYLRRVSVWPLINDLGLQCLRTPWS